MKPLNSVIVKVSSETNDMIKIQGEEGEVELFLVTSFAPTQHMRIYGTVIHSPISPGRRKIGEVYPGSPRAWPHTSGDDAERTIDGEKSPKMKEILLRKGIYSACGYEAEEVFNDGEGIEVIEGDTIWFHYLCLSDKDNWLGRGEDGLSVFRIPYGQIFCYKRQGLNMIGNNVLVQPYVGEGFEKETIGGADIWVKYSGNIIGYLHGKPKYLMGVVRHIGKGVGHETRQDVKAGDVVLFTRHSEFENSIDGQEYYKMVQKDIVAKVIGDTIVPVGDFVLLEPKYPMRPTVSVFNPNKKHIPGTIILLKDTVKKIKKDTAKVIDKGNGEEIENGDTVLLNTVPSVKFKERGVILSRYSDIMAVIG